MINKKYISYGVSMRLLLLFILTFTLLYPQKIALLIGNKMWQDEPYTYKEKKAFDDNKEYGKVLKWKNGKRYCQNLTLGGYKDWKTPNKYLLKQLYINKNKLKNLKLLNHWSSTSFNNLRAWAIYFNNGN